jgi:phosphatidylglycerophosphate synthase
VAPTQQTDRTDEGAHSAWQRYSPRPLTDGERWKAHELAKLQRRSYRPSAWVAFLRSSLELRRNANRRERPLMARQARAWGAGGAVAWVAAYAAVRRRENLQLRLMPGLLWWLAVWRMLDWHLGMAEGGDGHPRERLSPADAITLARFWLVPAASGTAHSSRGLPSVILLGGLTDWLDGSVARRRGRTRLGRDLDTTADLAFLTTVAFAARADGRISPLGFAVLTTRHLLGLAVALGAVFGRARRPAIRARPWGAALRIGGLATCTSGARRSGTVLLVAGSIVPPRSTATHLSRA